MTSEELFVRKGLTEDRKCGTMASADATSVLRRSRKYCRHDGKEKHTNMTQIYRNFKTWSDHLHDWVLSFKYTTNRQF